MKDAFRVIVLFGGTSNERFVSVASAQNLLQVRPDLRPWFMHPDGRVQECRSEEVLSHHRPFEVPFAVRPSGRLGSVEDAVAGLDPSYPTVLLLAVHGGAEEDGTLQRRLELLGAAFTGSPSIASALCFDKERAKAVVRDRGVAIAPGARLRGDAATVRQTISDWLRRVGPLIAKPVRGGSSLGLHHILDTESIDQVVDSVGQSDETYLIEQLVEGIEVSIGVIDGESGPRALVGTEIRKLPGGRFDYQGKYLGAHGVREVTPAQVAPELMTGAQRAALTAHQALGCFGYSRTDLILTGEGSPVFLETNSLPGLTPGSLIPQQLAASDILLDTFLESQIELAADRQTVARATLK